MPKLPAIAKLTAPRLEGVIARPRLDRLLDRGRRRALIWIVGPPGAGKTTAVAAWLRRRRLRHVWLQLDQGDSDVGGFFHFLCAAALPVAGPRALPEFKADALAAPELFARRFFRALCGARRPPAVLVLDDYQEVAVDSAVHPALAAGAGELGEGVTVVVVSRDEPPAPFARLRANGAMTLVGASDLAFNAREARSLMGRWRCRSPAEYAASEALRRTEGWAAGLVLALGGGGAARGVPERPGEEVLAGLFEQEVLERATPETRRLLLETAMLPTLDGATLARLTGVEGARETLARMARRGCFVARQGEAYQLHALFREFLRGRAQEVLTEGRRRELTRAAAAILEGEGQPEEAFALWARVGEWGEAARIVRQQAPALLRQGRTGTVIRWGSVLPAAVVGGDPWLRLHLGEARAQLDPRAGLSDMEGAFGAFASNGEGDGAALAWSTIVELQLFQLREMGPLDRWIAELERLPPAADGRVRARLTGAAFAALAHRQPWHPAFPEWEWRAMDLALSPGDADVRMRVAASLSLYYGGWVIDLARARLISSAMEPIASSGLASPGAVIPFRLGDAIRAVHDHDAEGGRRAARAGLELAEATGIHFWDGYLHQALLLGALADGDRGAAEEAFEALTRSAFGASPLAMSMYHHTAALMARWRGEPELAREHARTCRRLVEAAGVPHMRALYGVACALAEPPSPLKQELEALVEEGARCGARVVQAASQLGLGLLALRQGEEAEAERRVRQGFEAGRSVGCRFFGWFTRAEMAELSAIAMEHGIEAGYVAELIRVHRLEPPERARWLEEWPWEISVRALGRLEIRRNGVPIQAGRKAQKRPLEMLRLLVDSGPRGISKVSLAEALYPEAEGDASLHALETTVYRLRKLLGVNDAVTNDGGRVAIVPRLVFVDAWMVERLLERVEAGEPSAGDGVRDPRERLQRLYRGALFDSDPAGPESIGTRDRLRSRASRAGIGLPGGGSSRR